MPDLFSAKETAHRMEVLAKDVNKLFSYDATGGCSLAESKLVLELKALQSNPEHLKAVVSQIGWDNWKPNGLPTVELVTENNQVTLKIENTFTGDINISSSGKVEGSNFPANNEGAMQWAIKNFDALDKNKDGSLTYEEIQAANPQATDAASLPTLGHVMSSETTSGIGYGYSMSKYGSFGSPSVGFHSTSNEDVVMGITKSELAAVYLKNRQLNCSEKP